MPLGTLPAGVVSWLHLTELLVHGCDLGHAGGDATPIPAELAEPVLAFSTQMLAAMPRGDAPDRLVAFLGRDPDWRPPL